MLLRHLADWHLISLYEYPDDLLVAVSALIHGNSLLGAPCSQVSTGPKNGRQVTNLAKNDMYKAQAVSLAREYRLECDLNDPDCADYVVVIRNGQTFGYNYMKRDADSTPYGDINVDINDNAFIALGHSISVWANYWVPLA